jgi:hypothetical protein
MDWRLRGIPPALWRRVRDKAGDRLRDVLLGLLRAYADGRIDPLVDGDPVAAARGAVGGQMRAANLTDEQRRASARHAAQARWSSEKRDQ